MIDAGDAGLPSSRVTWSLKMRLPGVQPRRPSSQAKYPALFATAAVTCVLGFVFVALVLSLSWLSLHHWHDSYERTDN